MKWMRSNGMGNAAEGFGMAFIAYGVWLWSPQAAYIVMGVMACLVGMAVNRRPGGGDAE